MPSNIVETFMANPPGHSRNNFLKSPITGLGAIEKNRTARLYGQAKPSAV